MRYLLFVCALSLLAQNPRPAQSSILDEVFPHIADGGGWKSTITLVNMDTVDAAFTLDFYAPDGRPLTVSLRGQQRSSEYRGTIPLNGSVTFETTGEAPNVITGWARAASDQRIGGNLIFGRSLGADLPTLEASVPLTAWDEGEFALPFDNTNGFVTSMACYPRVGSFYSPETVTVTLYDESGARLYLDQFAVNAGQQQAFEVPTRWPAVANRRGVVYFRAGFYFSAIGLRFHPSGSFTTVNTLAK
ncbi:MAG: hypothetical protein IT165_32050 [Bryobacterales bacterium]|nr:hypothetical protein [Bryobacterales bacterium]